MLILAAETMGGSLLDARLWPPSMFFIRLGWIIDGATRGRDDDSDDDDDDDDDNNDADDADADDNAVDGK